MSGSGAIEPAAFRKALGLFATGVTVITVQREGIMHGMTANAFSALSLDPPLVLFCVGKGARMAKHLDGAEGFAVNILSADQERISAQFAGYDKQSDREVEQLQRGPIAPLIPGTLVSLTCTLEERHEGGDHWIVIGRVVEIHEPEGGNPRPPLAFFRSRYGTLIERGRALPDQVVWSNDAIRIYHEEWSADTDEKPEEEHVRANIWSQ